MRHVDQQQRTHGIRNLPEAREIDDARIGAATRDNHLRFIFVREAC
jgi:hypothetical protein